LPKHKKEVCVRADRLLILLGLGKAGEDALLKLLEALPSVYRRNAEQARERIYLDAAGWFHREEEAP